MSPVLSRSRGGFRLLFALPLLSLGFASPAIAQTTSTWDPSAAAGVQGGPGDWDLTTPNWTTDGGSSNATWPNGTSDSAVFSVTGGTVDLDGAINVQGITFQVDGYTIEDAGNDGTLTLTSGNSIAVTSGGDTAIITETISGTSGLNKTGDGTLILRTGAPGFTGNTTVSGGTLRLENAALGTGKTYGPIAGGATLEFFLDSGNANIGTIAKLEGTGILKKTGGSTLTQTSSGSIVEMSAGGKIHVAQGNYTFGATLPGTWTNNKGDLQIDSGATFRGASTEIVVDALTGDGFFQTGAGLTVGSNGGGGTFNGVIQDDGTYGDKSFNKTGGGTQTLTNANTFTGDTRVEGGTLALANTNALQNSDLDMNAADSGAVSIDSSLSTITLGGLKGSRNLTLENAAAGAVAATIGGNNKDTAYSGALGGSGSLEKAGNGNLVLSGNNNYTGKTIISSGTLTADSASALGSGGDINFEGGTLAYTANSAGTDWSGRIKDSSSAISIDTNGQNVTFSNALVSSNTSGLTKGGSGTLTLEADNSFTGATTINAGTLQVGNGATTGTLGSGQINVLTTLALNRSDGFSTSQTLDLRDGAIVRALDGDNTFSGAVNMNNTAGMTHTLEVASGATLTLSGANVGMNNTTLILQGDGDGTISKSLASGGAVAHVIKNGTGTWTLSSGSNGWSANGLTINGGTLATGAGNVIPDGAGKGNVTVNEFGTLNLNNGGDTINGLVGAGTVDITGGTARTLTVGAGDANGAFSGTLQDTGSGDLSLTKIGSGTQTLSGTVSYDGATRVDGGILEFDTGGAVNLGGQLELRNGATLRVGSGSVVFDVSSGNGLNLATTSAGGRLYAADGASITIADNVAFDNTTMPTLTLDGDGSGSGLFSGSLASGNAQGSVVVDGGIWTLTANNNNMTGSYTINDGGTLLVNGAINNVSSVTVNDGGTLGGSGTVNGPVTIEGIHSPGNSPGVQVNAGDLFYSGTPTVVWELVANDDTPGNRGTTFDGIDVGGNLDFLSATTLDLDFNLAGSTVDWSDTFWDRYAWHSWLLYDMTGGSSEIYNFQSLSVDSTEDWLDGQGDAFSSAANIPAGAGFFLKNTGSQIFLEYRAMPEPTTFGLLGLVLAAITSFVRPRRRRTV